MCPGGGWGVQGREIEGEGTEAPLASRSRDWEGSQDSTQGSILSPGAGVSAAPTATQRPHAPAESSAPWGPRPGPAASPDPGQTVAYPRFSLRPAHAAPSIAHPFSGPSPPPSSRDPMSHLLPIPSSLTRLLASPLLFLLLSPTPHPVLQSLRQAGGVLPTVCCSPITQTRHLRPGGVRCLLPLPPQHYCVACA